ncbi:L-type lectin-domain containing protein [Catalinimonas alkaloidigena]|nr:L-type lectin-domain containing protein [Catalinimonas alkaloidigena]
MRTTLFCLSMLLPVLVSAQFKFIGDAQPMDNDCILLTPDVEYREGIAYHTTRLDLSNYFEVQFDIYLGDKDDMGADGITFVMHDDVRGYQAYGTWGECIGYGRWSPAAGSGHSITPSVAVEFDTYQNYRQNDPPSDHVAYLENGVSLHETYWNNGDGGFNMEDDYMHDFRFRWDPDEQLITVFLDGQIVYKGKRDLINDVFGGATQVIWGFTASTGRKHNLQYFCLRRWAFAPDLVPADRH